MGGNNAGYLVTGIDFQRDVLVSLRLHELHMVPVDKGAAVTSHTTFRHYMQLTFLISSRHALKHCKPAHGTIIFVRFETTCNASSLLSASQGKVAL